MKNTPLSFLADHFAALQPRVVEIAGFPFSLRYKPLTAEQSIKYVHAAKAKSAREQATLFAELLIETVTLEDGSLAFPLERGKPSPVETLIRSTPPKLFSKLVEQLGKDVDENDVTEMEKKSEPEGEAGSSPSTSSPTSEAVPSST